MTRRFRRWLVLGGIAAIAASTAGGFAYARATSDGVISACAKKENGQLRLDTGGGCGPSEQAVQWSQTGPPGPPGPQGQQGQQGVPGMSDAWESYVYRGFTTPGNWIPIGLTRANLTDLVTLHLDEGNYLLSSQVLAADYTGNGTLVCRAGNNALGFSVGQNSLGNGPGHVSQLYLNFQTTFAIPAGGGDIVLSCWLAPDSGDPGQPIVGLGDVIATKVGTLH